ncbi:MAG: hypothetical protein JSS50_04480 [Proteobacteria bacterium]|nr:hypothetical protein [Pseudomonadota bacterium]
MAKDKILAERNLHNFNLVISEAVKGMSNAISAGNDKKAALDNAQLYCKRQLALSINGILQREYGTAFEGIIFSYNGKDNKFEMVIKDPEILRKMSGTTVTYDAPTPEQMKVRGNELAKALEDLNTELKTELAAAYDDIMSGEQDSPARYVKIKKEHRSAGIFLTVLAYALELGAVGAVVALSLRAAEMRALADQVLSKVGLTAHDVYSSYVDSNRGFTDLFNQVDVGIQDAIRKYIDLSNHHMIFIAAPIFIAIFTAAGLTVSWGIKPVVESIGHDKINEDVAKQFGLTETTVKEAIREADKKVAEAQKSGQTIKIDEILKADEGATAVAKMCNKMVKFAHACHETAERAAKEQGASISK